MRFKAFLQEETLSVKPVTTPMDQEAAFKWIQKNADTYARGCEDKVLWRGMNTNSGRPQYGDTRNFLRKSMATKNYYTLFIDSSERWDHYPDRSKSFVCSSHGETAQGFGNLHMVFPEDKALLGICPMYDLWQSFRGTLLKIDLNHLNTFNAFIEAIARAKGETFDENSADALRDQLKWYTVERLEELKTNHKHFQKYERFSSALTFLLTFMTNNDLDNLEEAIEELLNPDDNNFETIRASQWGSHFKPHREVWFEGKAVFIPIIWITRNQHFGQLFSDEYGWL